ncbi:uncharacterized protein LOC119350395 [Triticum dicoccoides]|uniref:uncharacterized protein LOC119350395 n=1 Tax=Triticum dicoccoides TaxID=85692 RepID=UPI00189057B8|nr:uncharacterized protein LOC119350395 [Triticum dicoccoides]
MDGAAHIAGDSPEANRASSSASSTDSASRRSRPRKGIHLRRCRRLLFARRGEGGEGDGKDADDDVQDLALSPGMSFAVVLAQRLNIRGRVYPAMLPVDGNKVPEKVWKGITDGEFNVLDTFEDEQYVREVVGISLTDSADTMMAYAYIWGNVDDPDLYSEWDFDVSISLHANCKHFPYID